MLNMQNYKQESWLVWVGINLNKQLDNKRKFLIEFLLS